MCGPGKPPGAGVSHIKMILVADTEFSRYTDHRFIAEKHIPFSIGVWSLPTR